MNHYSLRVAVPMADTDNGAIVEDDEAQLELQLALERYKCKYLTPYNVIV